MFLKKAWAFFERDLHEAWSYKSRLLLESAAIFAKCFVLFYLAKLLKPTAGGLELFGGDYFSYALLGVALTGYQASILESFSKAVYREQGAGTLEAILISPTSLQTVIFSGLFWSALLSVLRLAVYLGIGVLFFGLRFSSEEILPALVTLILTLSALSGLGMISAALILVYKRADPLAYALSGLSQLFSGVYFPAALLPSFLRNFSVFLPLTHSLEALREALLKGYGLGRLAPHLIALILFSVVLIPLGAGCFEWAVQKAKKDGSLTFF